MSGSPSRILVVEDDASVRAGLASSLGAEGFEVRTLTDGDGLETILDAFRPDLAILDIRLPSDRDGLELARSLRNRDDLPILFLTAVDGVDDRVAGFEAGGDDYVVKPFAMAEVLARVRALLRRTGRLHSRIIEVGDVVIDERTRTATRAGVELDLTPTELELLTALATKVGEVLSKTRLLSLVWEFDAYDDNLVEVHVSALRRKLEQHGPRIIHTVRGAGYVLRVDG
jgi:two-component system, OmpR family, response regulator